MFRKRRGIGLMRKAVIEGKARKMVLTTDTDMATTNREGQTLG